MTSWIIFSPREPKLAVRLDHEPTVKSKLLEFLRTEVDRGVFANSRPYILAASAKSMSMVYLQLVLRESGVSHPWSMWYGMKMRDFEASSYKALNRAIRAEYAKLDSRLASGPSRRSGRYSSPEDHEGGRCDIDNKNPKCSTYIAFLRRPPSP